MASIKILFETDNRSKRKSQSGGSYLPNPGINRNILARTQKMLTRKDFRLYRKLLQLNFFKNQSTQKGNR